LTSFIIVRKLLFGDPVNGWASTMCVILLCGSIQLLTIGILGQYLARVYSEVKGRPLYIVKEEE
jgi:glucosyltransferase